MSSPARAEVVVVGAEVVEAGDSAGGRPVTERVDGFVADRGFQVLDAGCPRAADRAMADGARTARAVLRTLRPSGTGDR